MAYHRKKRSQDQQDQPVPQVQSSSFASPDLTDIDADNSLSGDISNESTSMELHQQQASQSGYDFGNLPILGKRAAQPQSSLIQPKLTVSSVDKYEQEADQVADQVVDTTHRPSPGQVLNPPEQQKQTNTPLRMHPQEHIQRTDLEGSDTVGQVGIAGGQIPEHITSQIIGAQGRGQSLDPQLQRSMGQAMGTDFSRVKIHTDTQSHHLNEAIQAKAFTTGQDVFFRQGAYDPSSKGGQRLIAHELTHVVQQKGSGGHSIQNQLIQKVDWFGKGKGVVKGAKGIQLGVRGIGGGIGAIVLGMALGARQGGQIATKGLSKIKHKLSPSYNAIMDAKNQAKANYSEDTSSEEASDLSISDDLIARDTAVAVITQLAKGAKVGNVRAAAATVAKQYPKLIQYLENSPKGPEALDQLISTMPGSAAHHEKKFGYLAIQERFGIQNVSGFEGAALARLWKLLPTVPAKHLRTADNESLKGLVRYKGAEGWVPHGSYGKAKANIGYMGPAIELNWKVAHAFESTAKAEIGALPSFLGSRKAPLAKGKSNVFDQIVLHEIGHAVDQKLGVMNKYGKEKLFGGWKSHGSTSNPSNLIIAEYKKTTEGSNLQDVKINNIKDCIKGIVQDGSHVKKIMDKKIKAENERREGLKKYGITNQGSTSAITENERKDFIEEYRNYLPIKLAKATAQRSILDVLPWELSLKRLEEIAINGRIFHKAYEGTGDGPQDTWESYDLEARKATQVTNYQWRAPGEWFAEIYAHYFLGVLPKDHPAYDWFKNFIDQNEHISPDALQNPTEWKEKKEMESALADAYNEEDEKERAAQADYEKAYQDDYQ